MSLPLPAVRLPFSAEISVDRELIGISLGGDSCRAAAVRAVVSGRGLECRVQLVADAARPLPEDIWALFRLDGGSTSLSPQSLVGAGSRLAALCAELVDELAAPTELASIWAVGVHEAGLWAMAGGRPAGYLSLCDAAQLAESTGLTVIDAFPARDLAQGGQGRPVEALANWVLLHDSKRPRVLVELGDVVRLTYLPAACEASGAARVIALEAGAGVPMAAALSAEEIRRLAETTSRAVMERIPNTPPLRQVVLAGEGAKNKAIVEAITTHLAEVEVVSVDSIGIRGDILAATAAAVLTTLHLEQVPGTHMLTTGVASPRVLGRLTPGTPQNWQRLIKQLAANQPSTMSLRSAM